MNHDQHATLEARELSERLMRLPLDERLEVVRKATAGMTTTQWLDLLGGPLSSDVASIVWRHHSALGKAADYGARAVTYDFLELMRGPEAARRAVYGPPGVSDQQWHLDD